MSLRANYLIRQAWRCRSVCLRHFYDWKTRSDTIFALATSIQPTRGSPLGVIRVSGPKTSNVLRDIVKREPLSNSGFEHISGHSIKPRHATLARFLDPRDDELIDMGLVLWFPGPSSYTGDDSCEFHLHGSEAIIKRFMCLLGDISGLRPAEPGEFTRRAVENGKLSLIQAESLPELISAKTDQQRKIALQGLVGRTREKYEKWAQTLIGILAHLEASIDFGEDELIGEQEVVNECIEALKLLTAELSDFIAITSRCRDIVRSGARVSILGPPNAGKSTLMNILCGHEKSIVSDLSGTTRDVIEHTFDLGGHTLSICDTAGIRDTSKRNKGTPAGRQAEQSVIEQQHDSIELEGIKRALSTAKQSDAIVYLIDGATLCDAGVVPTIESLRELLATIDPDGKKSVHLAINKIDLKPELPNVDELTKSLKAELGQESLNVTFLSCRTNENIERLVEDLIGTLNDLQKCELGDQGEQVDYVNERHLSLLRSTVRHLKRAQTLDIRTIDEMAQHARESVDYLSRIVGSVDNDDVIDVIFRDFCIGK